MARFLGQFWILAGIVYYIANIGKWPCMDSYDIWFFESMDTMVKMEMLLRKRNLFVERRQKKEFPMIWTEEKKLNSWMAKGSIQNCELIIYLCIAHGVLWWKKWLNFSKINSKNDKTEYTDISTVKHRSNQCRLKTFGGPWARFHLRFPDWCGLVNWRGKQKGLHMLRQCHILQLSKGLFQMSLKQKQTLICFSPRKKPFHIRHWKLWQHLCASIQVLSNSVLLALFATLSDSCACRQ